MKISRTRFVKEWIKDLRSGKYGRGKGRLRDYNRHYCCLGVACLTGQRLGIKEASLRDGEQTGYNSFPGRWFLNIFKSRNPKLSSINARCASANDYYNLSFNKIADALEKEYL